MTDTMLSLKCCEICLNHLNDRLCKLGWMNPKVATGINSECVNMAAQPSIGHLQTLPILL